MSCSFNSYKIHKHGNDKCYVNSNTFSEVLLKNQY